MAETDAAALIEQFTGNKRRALDEAHFALLLEHVLVNHAALDEIIARHAVRSIDQLDEIGHAILLVALAEMSVCDDVPMKVSINEAVELSRRYGAVDGYKFVNAVLDKAGREICRTDS